jgi:N-acetylmuramoyl-L-alanine amidase
MARIFLSPSSQEHNSGVYAGYIEEIYCNKIADAAERHLKFNGHVVGRNDPAMGVTDHVKKAITFLADYVICIHTNATSDPKTRGMMVGCHSPNDAAKTSTIVSKKMMADLLEIMPTKNAKLTTWDFYEINHNIAPVVYLELAFHSNMDDCKFIVNNYKVIGKRIAKSICEFNGGKFKDIDAPVVVPKPTVFVPFLVEVTTDVLYIRNKPSIIFSKVVGTVRRNDVFTIVQTSGSWGKLKSGMGWISLKYTKKV